MTILIAGIWELGWNTPIKEIELWEFPLRDFSVDAFFMSPISGISSDAVQEKENLEALIEEYRSKVSIVFVDEKGKTSLKDFQHPENVMYVFGKASVSTMLVYGKPEDQSVRIETCQNKGLLWPHQAASIILYDRLTKSKA